ncbi:hypothetical protein BD770DRAFT_403144 [Pilaira anomala]|nr:hypothetical protein BD770DRAFT_403144 [Pilaira anomala]
MNSNINYSQMLNSMSSDISFEQTGSFEILNSKIDALSTQISSISGPIINAEDLGSLRVRVLTEMDLLKRAVTVETINTEDEQNNTRTIDACPPNCIRCVTAGGKLKYPHSTRRIDALLQQLNQMKYGNTSPALTPGELSELRLQQRSWKYDVRQVHKEYYAITLEQRAKMPGIDIFKCKGKWCAMTLLQENFKGKKQAFKNAERRKQQVGNL